MLAKNNSLYKPSLFPYCYLKFHCNQFVDILSLILKIGMILLFIESLSVQVFLSSQQSNNSCWRWTIGQIKWHSHQEIGHFIWVTRSTTWTPTFTLSFLQIVMQMHPISPPFGWESGWKVVSFSYLWNNCFTTYVCFVFWNSTTRVTTHNKSKALLF